MATFTGFLNSTANRVLDAQLTPEEREFREIMKKNLPLIRLAALVSVSVSFLLFSAFPNFFTALILAGHTYAAYEVYQVTTNLLTRLQSAFTEARTVLNNSQLEQATKNAPVCRAILEAIRVRYENH